MRTRVKICGITREQDLAAAAEAGADAIGLVFYPPSPRHLELERAARLARAAPPFVTVTALFVNATTAVVRAVIEAVRPQLLQFHGEETAAFCRDFGLPWLKACRVREGVDLVNYFSAYPDACGWLADAWADGYGGAGRCFDWSLVPAKPTRPLVLSGGLNSDNVAEAVRRVRPWAVDVSSGVESAKGIKDAARIAAFIAEVRHADV